jgi:type IV secretory pathway VirB2 component (pilin)
MHTLSKLAFAAALFAYGLNGALAQLPVTVDCPQQPCFNGPGLEGGVQTAGNVSGPIKGDVRTAVLTVLKTVLSYLALIALIAIIVAGFFLVAGGGSDASKDRAKKIILYVIIGLLVILFSRIIVEFFLQIGQDVQQ